MPTNKKVLFMVICLTDAMANIKQLTEELKKDDSADRLTGELFAQVQHVYRDLNRAWNAKAFADSDPLFDELFASISDEQRAQLERMPDDLILGE